MIYSMAELIQSIIPIIGVGNLFILAKALFEKYKGDKYTASESLNCFFISMFFAAVAIGVSQGILLIQPASNIIMHLLGLVLSIAMVPGTIVLCGKILPAMDDNKENKEIKQEGISDEIINKTDEKESPFDILAEMELAPSSIQQISLKCENHRNRIEALRVTSKESEKILRKYDSYYLPTVLKIVSSYIDAVESKTTVDALKSLEKSTVEAMTTYGELCLALEEHLVAENSDVADIEATTLKTIATMDGLTLGEEVFHKN